MTQPEFNGSALLAFFVISSLPNALKGRDFGTPALT
jgi:hypothetical protein